MYKKKAINNFIVIVEQTKTKTTDDKHDKHSNQEFYSATSLTLVFDICDTVQSLLSSVYQTYQFATRSWDY